MSKNEETFQRSLNLNVRDLGPSATLAINEKSKAMAAQGREIHYFGLGQSPFPVPDIMVEELKKNAHQKDYLPVKGLLSLREAVAQYHNRHDGLSATGEDVIIGPGSKELMFLVQLAFYGDLLIPAPSWVSYGPQASIIGRKIRWISTSQKDSWRLTPKALEEECKDDPSRPRLLILNYPSNPTGHSFSDKELMELSRVARKYKIILLSDEIYSGTHHQGKHTSIARFYPEGTIISGGISKWIGAGGWRLGTFTFPKNLRWLLDAIGVVASETYTSVSAPIQYAAIKAFEGGSEVDEYLLHSQKILRAVAQYVWEKLSSHSVIVSKPVGGFYLLPNFEPWRKNLEKRGIYTSKDLCHKLLEEASVATLPGVDFGRPAHELTMRLAFVDFDGAKALRESIKMGDAVRDHDEAFLKAYCPKIIKAVELMIAWLKQS